MVTADQMRILALALPEATENSHFEQPDFRVRNKIFAGLSRDGKQGNLKLTPEIQSSLLAGSAGVFSPAAGVWGARGWTHVHLAKAEVGVLRALLLEAYRLTAPKVLIARTRGETPAAPAASVGGTRTPKKASRKKRATAPRETKQPRTR